ncbi:MAG TPA: gamma-glutamyltransferase family protein [Acidimicrobiia bacterium]
MSPHRLATQAAMATLARGGNAVDAAISANAVQGVVAPETCGIGGDLFALIVAPGSDRPKTLNASGRAGSGAARLAEDLRAAGADEIPQRHPAAVTVPGCIDGWLEMNRSFGRLSLGEILEPAIRLARDGFPASRELAAAFAARHDELGDEPSAAAMYPNHRPPLEGERIRRPELAATLEGIAESGRAAFYSGRVGDALVRALEGHVTPDDLDRVQADWVEPLGLDLFGNTGWTIPPNSQGYISLLALGIVQRIGLVAPDEPAAWHLAIEAYRLAASDRDDVLADPETMTVRPQDLISEERIEQLADLYSPDRPADVGTARRPGGGTAFMCVTDRDGMGVSLIQSNFYGIGSGISVEGAGFLLHDRGRGFTLEREHPNELAPGKRPLHTLSPTIWTRAGDGLAAIIGTRGGFMQPQLVVQLAVRVMGHGDAPALAMAAPRWMVPLPRSGAGSPVQVEPGVSRVLVEELERRGHAVESLEVPQSGWGPMSVIRIGTDGLRTAAADPRLDTAMAAVD